MKTTLMTTFAAALLMLAGAAFALDLNPLADADQIGYPPVTTVASAHPAAMLPGPASDSEWDGDGLTRADAAVLVTATFSSIADADILGGSESGPASGDLAVAAACSDACTMACGSACADHCGTSCGTN